MERERATHSYPPLPQKAAFLWRRVSSLSLCICEVCRAGQSSTSGLASSTWTWAGEVSVGEAWVSTDSKAVGGPARAGRPGQSSDGPVGGPASSGCHAFAAGVREPQQAVCRRGGGLTVKFKHYTGWNVCWEPTWTCFTLGWARTVWPKVTWSGSPGAVATGNSLPWTLLIASGYDLCKRRRIRREMLKMIPFDNKPHAWIL